MLRNLENIHRTCVVEHLTIISTLSSIVLQLLQVIEKIEMNVFNSKYFSFKIDENTSLSNFFVIFVFFSS